jgi:hypothetical protein
MAYGTIKVDNITFDNGGSDQNVTVSGLYNSLTSGVTVTGTISGSVVIGSTSVSGTTVLGTTVTGTTVQGVSGTFTSLTGTTITGTTINAVTVASTTGTFTSLTGTTITGTSINGVTVAATTGSFTSLTGTTTSGTTANFVSGVFTTQISGATVTGTTANFTSGNFTSISGGTQTVTSGVFAVASAANPSISFASDPNTGLFSPGADQVAISTNGIERLRIISDGKVGLGSSTFNSVLTINNEVNASATGDFGGIFIKSVGATPGQGNLGGAISFSRINSGRRGSMIAAVESGADTDQQGLAFFTRAATTTANDDVAERLRIDEQGRLAINTTAPDALLTVNGIGAFGAGAVTTPSIAATGDLNTGFWFPAADTLAASTGGSERLRIDSAGLVGIGTSDPGTVGRSAYRNLVISGTGNRGLTINSGSGSAGGLVFNDTDGGFQGGISYLHTDDSMQVQVNNSERARIDSSGRLLVGTSSNSGGALLQVNGDRVRIATAKTPASASDTGVAGEICWDASYVYVCTATNTWKRTAISTW